MLIYARCSFPIEHVHKLPRVLSKIDLQLALLVNYELCRRKQDTCALVLILIVYIDFAPTQVKSLRWRIGPNFGETNLPVGDETDLSPSWSRDQSDIAHVIAEGTGD